MSLPAIDTPEPRMELIRYRYADQPTTILLARKDNGMVLGGTTGTPGGIWQAQFGVEAKEVASRSFVDEQTSVRWLKEQAKLYCGREDVDFEERAGEAQIVIPRSPMPRGRM